MTTNDEGRGGLKDRLPSHQAPAQLHDRVRGTLASHHPAGRPALLRWAGLAAAAALVFVAGMAAGRQTNRPEPAAPGPEARYALLLYGGYETAAEKASGSRATEYGRWAAGLTVGRFVSGEELGPVIGELGGRAPEPVAGFFLIDAPDEASALAVAKDCPHLKYGGRVIVQKLPRAG